MKILAYRFSSFGDVALVVPALRSILETHHEVEIHFVSRGAFAPMFNDLPRFHYHSIDLDNYVGILGLHRLYRELKAMEQWDVVVDLHGVLRTWMLDLFFRRGGFRVLEIDKGRSQKEKLTRKTGKTLTQLPHATQRYLDVFKKAGFPGELINEGAIHTRVDELYRTNLDKFLATIDIPDGKWIAVAPFSKHTQKEWPLARVQELVQQLRNDGHAVFLFGAGEEESKKLTSMADATSAINIADKLNLFEELALLEKIDVMVSMDSFNMHLGSLVGIRVVSIWGATHALAGFGPGKSNVPFMVQRTDLTCRPCSVFGNKRCYRGDLACLDIPVSEVYTMVNTTLELNPD